jgi:uncharacterized membrane protein
MVHFGRQKVSGLVLFMGLWLLIIFTVLVYAVAQWIEDLAAREGDMYFYLLAAVAVLFLAIPLIAARLRRKAQEENRQEAAENQKTEAL